MKRVVDISDEEYELCKKLDECGVVDTAIRKILKGKPYDERKTGKWTHGRELWREQIGDAITAISYENWRCGECGALVKDEASKVLWKYCPWCGAKMEGEEDAKS